MKHHREFSRFWCSMLWPVEKVVTITAVPSPVFKDVQEKKNGFFFRIPQCCSCLWYKASTQSNNVYFSCLSFLRWQNALLWLRTGLYWWLSKKVQQRLKTFRQNILIHSVQIRTVGNQCFQSLRMAECQGMFENHLDILLSGDFWTFFWFQLFFSFTHQMDEKYRQISAYSKAHLGILKETKKIFPLHFCKCPVCS